MLGAALQGPDPDRGGLEVDVHRPDGQGLGDPGAGVGEREGEGLVGWPRRQARGFEEALALNETLCRFCLIGAEWTAPRQLRYSGDYVYIG